MHLNRRDIGRARRPRAIAPVYRDKDRLANFLNAWSDLTNDIVVLSAVLECKIPFVETLLARPYLQEPRLNGSERIHCAAEIKRLIHKGAVTQVE